MSESQKQEDERQTQTQKESSKPGSKVIYKDDLKSDEDDEDEDDDIEEVDAYVDEKEVEASNVLAAANNLSSRIVSSMMKWFAGSNGNGNGNGDTDVVPKGMIIDGAITISSVKVKGQDSANFAEEKKTGFRRREMDH